ncbi:MAG: class I SAM-dependent methyltransferase [Acidobacteria bacterium]|nr:class I SAM-dependent methyltransferase [Acidobacteriota bacterium]
MALHEMDPANRFSTRAEAYRRHRPDYPAELLDKLLESEPEAVADIGAGTGISSMQIAERGPIVFAVEPNAAMREAGSLHPGIRWINGTAESTGLGPRSVDLVACFQAFHWFKPEVAVNEFTRILRPNGAIAAVWNERDPSDGFTAAYGDLVREISDNHPAESRVSAVSGLHDSDLLEEVQEHAFPHAQILDLDGLIGRAASTSYLPSSGRPYDDMIQRLKTLFEKWQEEGVVTLRYVSSLYLTSPR